eukprot:scaffold22559_cov111-Cylindrotheca_fusiformis.AAC.9
MTIAVNSTTSTSSSISMEGHRILEMSPKHEPGFSSPCYPQCQNGNVEPDLVGKGKGGISSVSIGTYPELVLFYKLKS